MKLKNWLIIIGIELFISIGLLIIKLLAKWSWLVFFIPLILFIIGDLVLFIILNRKKTEPVKEKTNTKELVKFSKELVFNDEDIPDNFLIQNKKTFNIGEKGTEATPIFICNGIGTETGNEIWIMINRNEQEEYNQFVNPKKEEISEAIRLLSKSPPTTEIIEKIDAGVDMLGNPIQKMKISRPTQAEVKKKEEEVKSEKEGGL